MPVYLITVHAYRSWREDNPRGYVQRGAPGIKQPNTKLARHRSASATHPPVRFSDQQIGLILGTLHEICLKLDIKSYAASCTPTHWHLLVGWVAPNQSESAIDKKIRSIATRLKRIVVLKLSADVGQSGHRWFSRGWHIERIDGQKHFDHLIESYLPKHVSEGGKFIAWIRQ